MSVRKGGLTLLAAVALAGCGQASSPNAKLGDRGGQNATQTPVLHGHPQVIEPVAGAAGAAAGPTGPSSVSVDQGRSTSGALAQPVSDTEIRAELKASGLTANASQAMLTTTGLAIAPVNAPGVVQTIIDAGNGITHLPYRFGGGHGTFEDNAYDCSGSLSFVFAAAGLLNTTMTSGQLMSWGKPGPGKWITVFAAPGHTFMYIAGLRFDTVALAETGSRWSNHSADEPDLNRFVVRHPAGL